MCSSSSVLLVSLCLLLCLRPCLSSGVNIPAEPGQSVSLSCRVPSNTDITAVEWTRPGLEPEYVLRYRSKGINPDNQHPSYQNRVDLKDRDMKDGDVSMILENVTRDDTGTYECHVVQRKTNHGSSSGPISIVHLQVHQSGDTQETGRDEEGGDKKGGDKGLQIGLGVGLTAAALLVVVVGFYKCKNQRSYRAAYRAARTGPPAD